MKHFGLWIFSIGLGMILGGFIDLSLRGSDSSEWTPSLLLTGFLMALFSLLAISPEDRRYLP